MSALFTLFALAGLAARRASVCLGLTIAALAAACGPDQPASPDTTPACDAGDCTPVPATWAVVTETLPGALFSVWGTSETDVWMAGAADPKAPAKGPTVLHWTGSAWERPVIAAPGVDLWWVNGLGDDVWFAGSKGTIVRWKRAAATAEVMQAPSKDQLWGVLPLAANNVWAVGGRPECDAGSSCGVIWHYDGKAWVTAPGLSAALRDEATWFKAWARAPNDLYVCGSGGKMLRYDGKTWTSVASGTTRTLFTVHGHGKLVVAVGGFGTGTLVEDTGSGFKDVTPKGMSQVNGVFVLPDGKAVAVGFAGEVWLRTPAGWQPDLTAPEALRDFHATWATPGGAIWAVGGNIMSAPFTEGQIAHRGAKVLAP